MNADANFVFLPQAVEALREELGSAFNHQFSLAGAWHTYPVAGDLFTDKRLSRHMFVVVSRLFEWDDKSECYRIQLLLDIAPNTDLPRHFAVVPDGN